MDIEWVVVANRSGAKIFKIKGASAPTLIKEISHPRGLLDREIN